MRRFKEGDIVFMRRFNENRNDWELVHDFPFIVIKSGEIVQVMGGQNGQVHTVNEIMIVDEEEARMLGPCQER